jgi:hypothetical protein
MSNAEHRFSEAETNGVRQLHGIVRRWADMQI